MSKEEHILVVDDEAVIRELMHDILSDEGFSVEVAPDGRAALDLLKQRGEFVVLFTDIMMPEMDGIELIRHARKVAPHVVPIVMTGYATLETARAAVKEGAYDYVLKPFNLSEIKLAVTNALERRRLLNENARLLDLTGLFNISENIASIREEDGLLRFVLHAALERVRARRGSLMLVDEDRKLLRVACSVGLAKVYEGAEAPLEGSIAGMVARKVEPLLVRDIDTDPQVHTLAHGIKESRSFISVPLERKASPLEGGNIIEAATPQVVAVLNATQKASGEEFTESDLKVLSIVANHAAAALENVRLIRDIEDAQREVLFTLGEIVETRSRETGHHVKRVAEYSRLLALKCGVPHPEAEMLRLASPLHDVGKVGIPDAILNKPGKLTAEEFDIIKTHTTIGYDMLKVSSGKVLKMAALIALEHHERYDGKGYPRAKAGTDISILGRITCVADVFDALGVDRVYKDAWPLEKILDYFREQRGKQFDPTIVDIFFDNLDDILAIRSAFPEHVLA